MCRCLPLLALVLTLAGCAPRASELEPPPPPAAVLSDVQAQPAPPPPPPAQPVPVRTAQTEYDAGMELLKQQKYFQAAVQFERAVSLNPTFFDAWNDLSYARLRERGDRHANPPGVQIYSYQGAINAARQALTILPDSAHAGYNLGLALLASGEYQEAIGPLIRSSELQPERPEPMVALGLAYLGVGELERTLPLCRRAGEISPDYLPALRCLEAAGDGFTRLPAEEAAVGQFAYRPDQASFRWTGAPEGLGEAEFSRTSPPWSCAFTYPNGYRWAFIGCDGRAGIYMYAWGFTSAASGLTPSQIGVGQPWELVEQTYGPTYQSQEGLHYAVADLHMTIRRDREQPVISSISFSTVSPLFAIEDLIHDRLYP